MSHIALLWSGSFGRTAGIDRSQFDTYTKLLFTTNKPMASEFAWPRSPLFLMAHIKRTVQRRMLRVNSKSNPSIVVSTLLFIMPATREKYPTTFRSVCLIAACSVAMVVNVCPNWLLCSIYPIPINLSDSSDRKYYECGDCSAGYGQGPQYPGAKIAVAGFSLLTGLGTVFILCNDAIHEGHF